MDNRDYPLLFDEEDEYQLTSSPAVRRSQMPRRQQGHLPSVRTPEQQAIVKARILQEEVTEQREIITKRVTETKGELVLHTDAVYGECVDRLVDRKDAIEHPEKKELRVRFMRRALGKLPDALERSLDTAFDELDRTERQDLSTLVSSPTYEPEPVREEVYEHIDVTFGDWWRGGKWITR